MVDTKGKIVFIGHPSSRQNLEQDIDHLLAGRQISGEGTEPGAGGGEEEEEKDLDGFEHNIDAENVEAAKTKFNEIGEANCKGELMKYAAEGCERAGTCFFHSNRFDCKTR